MTKNIIKNIISQQQTCDLLKLKILNLAKDLGYSTVHDEIIVQNKLEWDNFIQSLIKAVKGVR